MTEELEARLVACFAPIAGEADRARVVAALLFVKRISDEHEDAASPSRRLRMVAGGSFAELLQLPRAEAVGDAVLRLCAVNGWPLPPAPVLAADEIAPAPLAIVMRALAAIDLGPARVSIDQLLAAGDRLLADAPTPRDGADGPRALLERLRRPVPTPSQPLDDTLQATHPVTPAGSSQPPPSLARGATLGRYLVLELLGRGGWGEVYAAFDPELDRKIAVKVMRPEAGGESRDSEGRARLLREAQAMARLNHPNVIAVHDVGLLPMGPASRPGTGEGDERVFIAMEFVDGATLRHWLEAEPRTWREVLDVFVQAGRGLAAAHAAGLIHRDFKPDNVLVGKDGRVRVLDFGLVRSTSLDEPPLEPEASLQAAAGAGVFDTPLSTPLTRTGALMGTPAYMSPEQMTGGSTDARTDQFSFCVALYRALYGVHPFAGDSIQRILVEVHSARIVPPQRERQVPAWLRPIVTRGLKLDPAQRFASMEALLAALQHDPSRVRRRWLVGGGTVVGVAALVGVLALTLRQRRALCTQGAAHVAGVWQARERLAVEQAFLATDRPFAADAVATVTHALDDFAQKWAAGFDDACAATRLRGEQSDELLDLRMQCLSQELAEVKEATQLFTRADGKLVENAAKAAAALPQPGDCADVQALKAPARLPSDPELRARVTKVRAELARARAALDASRFGDGLPIANFAVAAAREIGYGPLLAEALLTQGQLERESGDSTSARPHLGEAALAAESSHADGVAAQAQIQRLRVAYDEGKFPEGEELARWAQAAVARTGEPRWQASLDNVLGGLYMAEAKYDAAMDVYRQALAIHQRIGSPLLLVASTMSNVANIEYSRQRYTEAIATYQEALELKRRAVGKDHPSVGATLNNLANAYADQNRFEEALATYRQALDIWRRALGPKHRDVVMCLGNIGSTLNQMGRHREAVHTDREVLALQEELLGPDHPDVAATLVNLGVALVMDGRPAEALPVLARAQRIQEATIGTAHDEYAAMLGAQAKAHEALGHHAQALALAERAIAIREKAIGPGSAAPAWFATVGEAELGLHQTAAARAALDKAMAIMRAQKQADAGLLARVRGDLERARPR